MANRFVGSLLILVALAATWGAGRAQAASGTFGPETLEMGGGGSGQTVAVIGPLADDGYVTAGLVITDAPVGEVGVALFCSVSSSSYGWTVPVPDSLPLDASGLSAYGEVGTECQVEISSQSAGSLSYEDGSWDAPDAPDPSPMAVAVVAYSDELVDQTKIAAVLSLGSFGIVIVLLGIIAVATVVGAGR